MKPISALFLVACCWASSGFAQQPVTYYVSPRGKDSNAGTFEKPFATLQRARETIRANKKRDKEGPYTVCIREGHYFLHSSLVFDSLDGGTRENPVVYTAYQNEEVHFTGGVTVPVAQATAIKDPAVLRRLDSSVRNKVLQIDLKKLGIRDYGVIYPKGFGRAYTPSAMELFCNHQAMVLARWPNDSMVPVGKVLDPGSIPRNGDYSHRGGVFTYATSRPSRWSEAGEPWISGFFKYGYADDAVKVARLDTVNKTVTTAQETMYGFEGGKVFQRWYAFNLLEEIDEPGEYYIDRSTGMLYFYPPTGGLETIELSITEEPLLVFRDASFIRVRKITFECGRGMGVYMEKGRENVLDSCVFRNLGMMAVTIGEGIEPFGQLRLSGTGTPVSGKVGSLYGHLYDNTVFNRQGGKGHVISNCTIYDTGSGGIILGGGDRRTLEKGNNQVYNCTIYRFNRIERSYKAGVNIDGVGNSITHCEIYDCPGSAILMHGNDHLIAYNNIHDAVKDGDDMGAIYYGRDPSESGNRIQYNFFHHIGNNYGTIMAVYHDDGACGAEVSGNVFYKAGSRTVMIGGGNDNRYYNNIFIDCPLAFHLDNRLMNWAKGLIAKNGLFEQRLQAVRYRQPPYATEYPTLARYFDDRPGVPKRNFIERNLFVHVTMIHNGSPEWSYIGKNYISCDESMFVDYAHMDFNLKPNADVFKKMPDFVPVPFGKMGVVGARPGGF